MVVFRAAMSCVYRGLCRNSALQGGKLWTAAHFSGLCVGIGETQAAVETRRDFRDDNSEASRGLGPGAR